jgi:hypothetical protein
MDIPTSGLLGILCCTCIGVECCVYWARRVYREPYVEIQAEADTLFHEVTEVDPSNYLTDQDGKHTCIICTEEMNESIVECMRCNKYVGHAACIHQWIQIEVQQQRILTCPYCRQA